MEQKSQAMGVGRSTMYPEAGSPEAWYDVKAFFRVSAISRILPTFFVPFIHLFTHPRQRSRGIEGRGGILYFLLIFLCPGRVYSFLHFYIILYCVSFLREAGMRGRCGAGTPYWWHTYLFLGHLMCGVQPWAHRGIQRWKREQIVYWAKLSHEPYVHSSHHSCEIGAFTAI